MTAFIISLVIGIIICILGAKNMQGDISSLHSYHRNRVSPEDVKPFGKLVGIGTIIMGVSVMIMGTLTYLAILTESDIYTIIGTALMFIGMAFGITITFYAMKKYNGGIF